MTSSHATKAHTTAQRLAFSSDWLVPIVSIVLALLVGLLFLTATPVQTRLAFSLGGTDFLTARNFHNGETTADGRGFRWTMGDSTLALPAQGFGPHTLRLTISAPWSIGTSLPVTLTINGHPLPSIASSAQTRRYALLVPATQVRLGENLLRIESPTFRPVEINREKRDLGIVVFDASWQRLNAQPWLPLLQVCVITLAVALLYFLLARAGIGVWMRVLALVLFLAITLAMRHSDTRFVYRWQATLWTGGLCVGLFVATLALRSSAGSRAGTVLHPVSAVLRVHWPALLGYVAVTSALLAPLLLHIPTQIIGFPGDAYEYLWKMQWFSDALFTQHVSPAFAPQIFFPVGYELALSEMTPSHTLLGAPLTWLFGPIASYNLLIIASFLLSGCFTYFLALRLGARRGAAFVAGLVFAFCMRRYYHALGHLPMMGTQWLPLAIYGWEGVLTRRRTWDGFVTGLGLALATWSSWYQGTTLVLLLAAYTPIRLGIRGLPELLRLWRPIVVTGALTLALVLPLAQPYIETRQAGELAQQPYIQLLLHSARLSEYLHLNALHPLWGTWAQQFYRNDGGERLVAFGYTALLLGLVGIWAARRQRIAWTLAIIALINVVMTLGPEWGLPNGQYIPLPARFAYEYVPVLNNIRVWTRMSLYVTLCAALLGSLALSALPPRLRAGWLVAAGLVLLESVSVFPLDTPRPRAVDLWLRDQPAGTVIEMPNSFSGPGEFYTLFSHKANNVGYGSFDPPLYDEGKGILRRFPDEPTLRLLQRWQTDYIIVNEYLMRERDPNWETALAAQPLVAQVYQAQGYRVYRLLR